jgi:hypothetical protein
MKVVVAKTGGFCKGVKDALEITLESIQKRQDDKSRIERELNARKNDVTKCQQEVAEVRTRLSSWPDIWPDYKPSAVAPEGNIQSQPSQPGQQKSTTPGRQTPSRKSIPTDTNKPKK